MPISNYPTEGMKEEARRGLAWRKEFGRGGTRIGQIRARQIVAGENLSDTTVKRMFSFFSRQEGVKKAEGFRPGEEGYPSNGRIAWALWGGDPGFSWSRKLVNQMKDKRSIRQLSGKALEGVKNKVKEHNEKVGNVASKRTTVAILSKVYERGVGAYKNNPSSVRPSVKSPEQWAMARVNSFLYALRNGRFRSGKHDTDLLPKGHPMSSKEEKNMSENQEVRHIEEVIEEDDGYTIKFKKADSEMGMDMNIEDEEKSDAIEEQKDNELDVNFTPEDELNLSLNDVEDERVETAKLETREAVFPLEFRQDETDDRTVEMSISSESPVARSFGLEVLSHQEGDIDMSRLLNKAPLLKDHDASQQIGVVENAYLDNQRGKLMSRVRFGRGTLASEIFNDVKDGIRTQVSIGYQINPDSMVKSETTDEVRVTDWMPMEVSIVSMGADQNVGFGRSLSLNQQTKTEKTKEVIMTEETKSVDVEEQVRVKTDEILAKREKEIAEIIELGARHQKQDLAKQAIRDGKDLSSFRGELLTQIENQPLESQEIGLTETEAREFSIVKMAKHHAGMQVDADFEIEASRAYAKKLGRTPSGFFVPEDVTNSWGKRTMNTTNSAGVVYDEKQYANLIDALTPYSTVLQANPTVLSNNTGNITIPRISSLSNSGWVTEGNDVSASDPSIDTVTLSEKTNGAFTDLTRTLLQNTDGFSVENMVRNNLLRAMGVTWDQASVSGTGAGGQPTGIENTAGVNSTAFGVAGAPTFAELIEMQTKIFEDNSTLDTNSVRYITTPALYGFGKSLATNGAGSPVAIRDDFLDGIQVLISSQVTANTFILGDFSEFIVATWGGLDVTVDQYALATSGGLRLIALSSVDYAVKHPVSFCVSA